MQEIQKEFKAILSALKRYGPKKPDYVTTKNNLPINPKILCDGREEIINAFKNKKFPFGVEEPPDLIQRPDESDESDENDDKFYTPRQLETIRELSNFENEIETPRDMPDLETEESAAQRRN